jgi:hypothetical protein
MLDPTARYKLRELSQTVISPTLQNQLGSPFS